MIDLICLLYAKTACSAISFFRGPGRRRLKTGRGRRTACRTGAGRRARRRRYGRRRRVLRQNQRDDGHAGCLSEISGQGQHAGRDAVIGWLDGAHDGAVVRRAEQGRSRPDEDEKSCDCGDGRVGTDGEAGQSQRCQGQAGRRDRHGAVGVRQGAGFRRQQGHDDGLDEEYQARDGR